MAAARKIVIVGVDSLMLGFCNRLVESGSMPALGGLMNRGCVSAAYPSYPTCSATNWATIATGADPQTHGVLTGSFGSTRYRADTLWQAVERNEGRAILLNWPGAFSTDYQRSIVLANGKPSEDPFQLAPCALYALEEVGRRRGEVPSSLRAVPLRLTAPEGWAYPPDSGLPPLGAEVPLGGTGEVELPTWHALLYATADRGYDRVMLTPNRDASAPAAELATGDWSAPLTIGARRRGADLEAACRFKLVELAADATQLLLYRSAVYPLSGFSHPEAVSRALVRELGAYTGSPGRLPLSCGWFDLYEEENARHLEWLTQAALHLMAHEQWDILALQCSSPDHLMHEIWSGLDPAAPEHDPARAEFFWNTMGRDLAQVDAVLAAITEAAPDDALICVVSDHGHLPNLGTVNILGCLQRAGLVVLSPENGALDRVQSRVWPRLADVRVRLQGRDEGGIVPPEEYDAVCEQVIDALLAIRSREGRRVVTLAIRRQDAGFLGLDSPAAGDVIFALAPGYTHRLHGSHPTSLVAPPNYTDPSGGTESIHGVHLPGASRGIGRMEAFFCLAGPGVRRGFIRPRPIWLRDVAPTLAHLGGVPVPQQAEGRVCTEFLA